MQLAYPQLEKHLQQGIQPLYVVHGDEPLLQQEAADAIRAAARRQGHTERTVLTATGAHFDWSSVAASGQEMSLFGDKQLIDIRIPSGKPGKDGAQVLQQLGQQAKQRAGGQAPDVVTLVALPKLDSTQQKSAWFMALESGGVSIKIDAIDRKQLPNWIAQRLALQQQRVQSGPEGVRTLQWFSDCVEGNLLAAHQEVQKLALLHPTGELGFEQVSTAVLNVARYDPAQLSEAVLQGHAGRAQKVLDGLLAEGMSTVQIHYRLADDALALQRVHATVARGYALPMALRDERIWGVREKLFARVVPLLNNAKVNALVVAAHQIDGITKGLEHANWPKDATLAMHQWVIMFAKACGASTLKNL